MDSVSREGYIRNFTSHHVFFLSCVVKVSHCRKTGIMFTGQMNEQIVLQNVFAVGFQLKLEVYIHIG